MSEKSIQQKLQAALQSLSAFADADVVINDWGILDESEMRSPYVVIHTTDDFVARQDVRTPGTTWNVPFTLYVRFSDWRETLNEFRDKRQAIIDLINTGSNRSASGLDLIEIRNMGDIMPYPENLQDEQLPWFIYQTLIAEAREF